MINWKRNNINKQTDRVRYYCMKNLFIGCFVLIQCFGPICAIIVKG